MCIRSDVPHGVQQVKRSDDVVGLDENGVGDVHHRIRSRGAFPKMHDRIGLKITENLFYRTVLAQVGLPELQFFTETRSECLQALGHCTNGCGTPRPHLLHPCPSEESVCAPYFVSS